MSNEILKFADTATNILTQSEYAADVERNSGNVPGVARSKLVNKVLRQCAFISNAFAEYLIARVGGDVLDDNDSAALLAKITSAFTFGFVNPNFVINGNFDFWQSNTTFNVAADKTYTADQWFTGMAGSTSVVSRQATAGTESFNARFFKRSTVTSSVNVANFNRDTTPLEDVRKLSGKQVTISFWAKADSSRNMSLEFVQNFGTGGSPSAEVNTIGVQKYALTTSWQQFTKTVTMPSISGKVLGTNENHYTGINFWQDAGANYDSRTDTLGQQSGTFDIAQIKLEYGSVATNFSLSGNGLEGELLNCQRFFSKSFDTETIPANGGSITTFVGNPEPFLLMRPGTSIFYSTPIKSPLPAPMRAVPTVAIFGNNSGNWQFYNTNDGIMYSVPNANGVANSTTKLTFVAGALVTPGFATIGVGHWTANARL